MENETLQPAPYIGAIVNYVLEDGWSRGQTRPAIIVKVWGNRDCGLVVFMDGQNDVRPSPDPENFLIIGEPTNWKDSRKQSAQPKPGYWHWPKIFGVMGKVSELKVGKSLEEMIREVVQAELRRFEEDIRRSIARQLEDSQTAKENALLDLKTQIQRAIDDWSHNLTHPNIKGY